MQDLRGFQQAVAGAPQPRDVRAPSRAWSAILAGSSSPSTTSPTRKAYQILRDVRKEHMSYWDLVKLGSRAARAL